MIISAVAMTIIPTAIEMTLTATEILPEERKQMVSYLDLFKT